MTRPRWGEVADDAASKAMLFGVRACSSLAPLLEKQRVVTSDVAGQLTGGGDDSEQHQLHIFRILVRAFGLRGR